MYKCRYYHMCEKMFNLRSDECEHGDAHEKKNDCKSRRCSLLGMFVTCDQEKEGK